MNRIAPSGLPAGHARRSAPAQDPSPPPSFGELPSDAVRSVGRYLALADLAAMRRVSRRVERDLRQQFRAAQISESQAPRVATLARFRTLIGGGEPTPETPNTVVRLPMELRARPLAALGGRILALPEEDRQAAAESLLAVPVDAPTPLLQELRDAARGSAHGLQRRETDLVWGGSATAAVVAGRNVQEVAGTFGITSAESLRYLDGIAISLATE
jgi:hypothetical protein